MPTAILLDWAELLIRWLHVVAGIAWIGSSFYFIHLDLSLKQREHLPEQAFGDAWQVHGGGFYHMVKYLVAPKQMPDELTWFKWEAYATWLSGMALLAVVYYFAAGLYLIDTHVMALAPWQAVRLSLAGLVAGWVIYDGICRSSLGNDDRALLGVGFAFLVLAAYVFTQIFSARGAFMEIGALIGTIMVANVAMVIIPGQRKVVAALLKGRNPRSHSRQARQTAQPAQQLSHVAGRVRDDRQPLSVRLRHALELGHLRPGDRDRRGGAALLQQPPQGPALALVDLGRGGGLRDRGDLAEHARGRAMALEPAPIPPSRWCSPTLRT